MKIGTKTQIMAPGHYQPWRGRWSTRDTDCSCSVFRQRLHTFREAPPANRQQLCLGSSSQL